MYICIEHCISHYNGMKEIRNLKVNSYSRYYMMYEMEDHIKHNMLENISIYNITILIVEITKNSYYFTQIILNYLIPLIIYYRAYVHIHLYFCL